MSTIELVIWSSMAGGMLTVSLASLADSLLHRSPGAFMGFTFVTLLSLYATLLSGLVELLFPHLPTLLLNLLKIGLGPLCCGMALLYTGRWLQGGAYDPWIVRIVRWGSRSMSLLTVVLSGLSALATPQQIDALLLLSALSCLVTIALTGLCAWRAASQGDSLAVWIAPSAVAMGLTVVGLYTHAAYPGMLATGWVALTAFSAIAYLLNITALVIVRTRQIKHLRRLAGMEIGLDPATGLPTGSALLSKVDDAFWRAARSGMVCNVVCMHLHNLYDLGDLAGHGVEQQIAIAMSARIRRAVGFRCVVGLYHARCFVAVIQVSKQSSAAQIDGFIQRLRYLISKPLHVQGHRSTTHDFTPDWGIAVVSSKPEQSDSSEVLRAAEREAMRPSEAAQPVAAAA